MEHVCHAGGGGACSGGTTSLDVNQTAAPKATLKTKFVSCVAGGRNCRQSGGRKFIFFPFFFVFFW